LKFVAVRDCWGVPARSIMWNMNLGLPEMIFIFVMALIIFGPKKLPEIGRQIGRALNEFKRASNEFKSQIESEIGQLDSEGTRRDILAGLDLPKGILPRDSKEEVQIEHVPRLEHQLDPDEILPSEAKPPVPEVNTATKAPDA